MIGRSPSMNRPYAWLLTVDAGVRHYEQDEVTSDKRRGPSSTERGTHFAEAVAGESTGKAEDDNRW